MQRIYPNQTPTSELHQYIIGSVSPRPIAFVSSLSAEGQPNLAPYSFFNAFSSNPPTLVFSSNRRGRENTTKDTLENVKAQPEVVINVVNHGIAHQMALCSVEFPHGVNEFEKAGLTPLPSEMVQPARVKESPVQMECKVKDIITLGDGGGAGHLILCEILLMHIAEDVLDADHKIDPYKMDLVGRLGQSYYCRVQAPSIFSIQQSVKQIGIGFDGLPANVRESEVLTGKHLSMLASVEVLPEAGAEAAPSSMAPAAVKKRHETARALLEAGDVAAAWNILQGASLEE